MAETESCNAPACRNPDSAPPAELELDILRQLLKLVDYTDACNLSVTCRAWKTVSREIWQYRVGQRWKSGSNEWDSLKSEGKWFDLYAQRHTLDQASEKALKEMAWPTKRDAAQDHFLACGVDCMDILTAGAHAQGPQDVGRRYWSRHVLSAIQTRVSALGLEKLMSQPWKADKRIEKGALLIAQAHYPLSDLSIVERKIDMLGEELKRRMLERGVEGGREALRLLDHLLMGPAAPGTFPSSANSANGNDDSDDDDDEHVTDRTVDGWLDNSERDEKQAEGVDMEQELLAFVPKPGYGLGMKGNSQDYHNPSNSLLNEVLQQRRGIPISLALLHMAVGKRAGIRVQLMNMPMHVINRVILTPLPPRSAQGGPGEGSGNGSGAADAGGEEGEEGEDPLEEEGAAHDLNSHDVLFVDVYGGRMMDWDELMMFMSDLGINLPHSRLHPLTPQGIYQRMCANLVHIYNSRRDHEKLKIVLELVTAINPEAKEYWTQRSRIAESNKDFADASRSMKHLRGLVLRSEPDPFKRRNAEMHLSHVQRKLDLQHIAYQQGCMRQKPRTPSILFNVGDVVKHVRYSYRALIYDWDPTCSVDEYWIQQMGVDALPGGRRQPFYHVLVDIRDRPFQNTYVAQCNLELLSLNRPEHDAVQHPDVGQYFEGLEEVLLPRGASDAPATSYQPCASPDVPATSNQPYAPSDAPATSNQLCAPSDAPATSNQRSQPTTKGASGSQEGDRGLQEGSSGAKDAMDCTSAEDRSGAEEDDGAKGSGAKDEKDCTSAEDRGGAEEDNGAKGRGAKHAKGCTSAEDRSGAEEDDGANKDSGAKEGSVDEEVQEPQGGEAGIEGDSGSGVEHIKVESFYTLAASEHGSKAAPPAIDSGAAGGSPGDSAGVKVVKRLRYKPNNYLLYHFPGDQGRG